MERECPRQGVAAVGGVLGSGGLGGVATATAAAMSTERATARPERGRRLVPDARRAEILAAALRLFAERPYAGVSTAELAHEAGVARGLINHYFGTKRELYLAVVRRLVRIPDDAGSGDPGAAVDWFLDAVERHRGLWLAVGTGASGDPEVDDILAEADEIAAARVLADLAPARVGDPVLAARVRSFFGLVRSASREWLVRGALDRAQTRALLVAGLRSVLEHDSQV